MDDLEEAITLHRRALALRPSDHPDHSEINNLANAVSRLFRKIAELIFVLLATPVSPALSTTPEMRSRQLGKIDYHLEESIVYHLQVRILHLLTIPATLTLLMTSQTPYPRALISWAR
jgi:hypothetical protein